MKRRTLRTSATVFAALASISGASIACAQTGTAVAPAQIATAGALRRYAALKVMLLPVQGVRTDAYPAWRVNPKRDTVVTRSVDRAIEMALGERGLAKQWVFLSEMQRAARRNPTYITDPYDVRAADVLRFAMRKPSEPLGEPLVSQLRALAGVSDSRYALIPIELRFEPGADSTGHAVLRIAAVDARAAQLLWVGDVIGNDVATFSPAVISELAQRVADLVVPR